MTDVISKEAPLFLADTDDHDAPLFLADPDDGLRSPSASPARRPGTTTVMDDDDNILNATRKLPAPARQPPPNDALRTLDEELARNVTIDDFDIDAERAKAAARETMHRMAQENARRYARPEAMQDKDKEPEVKKRKPIPKLDDNRLLGADGFPALLKEYKSFKPKGKGHELEDLTRLLQLYQFWTHKMFPKMQFNDAVDRIEKLCHSKRMLTALSVWKDGPANKEDGGQPENDNEDGEAVDAQREPSAAGGSSPASAAAATDDDDDWELKLLAKAGTRDRDGSSPVKSRASSAAPPPSSSEGEDNFDFDFDEDALAQIDASAAAKPTAKAISNDDFDMDEDQWGAAPFDDALIFFGRSSPTPQTAPATDARGLTTKAPVSTAAVDEEMEEWDAFGNEPDLPPVILHSEPRPAANSPAPIPPVKEAPAPPPSAEEAEDDEFELTQAQLDALDEMEMYD